MRLNRVDGSVCANNSKTVWPQGGKDNVMFSRMMVTTILEVGADADLEAAITSLLLAAEQAEIVRWIEFPSSVLLFLLGRGKRNPAGSTSWTARATGPRTP